MSEEPGLGPAWARGTRCCGKPVGCTNMGEGCRMLNHPWKQWHRKEFGGGQEEPPAAAPPSADGD